MDLEDSKGVVDEADASRSIEERLRERVARTDAEEIRDKCRIADR